jgi:hypothetical protein
MSSILSYPSLIHFAGKVIERREAFTLVSLFTKSHEKRSITLQGITLQAK